MSESGAYLKGNRRRTDHQALSNSHLVVWAPELRGWLRQRRNKRTIQKGTSKKRLMLTHVPWERRKRGQEVSRRKEHQKKENPRVLLLRQKKRHKERSGEFKVQRLTSNPSTTRKDRKNHKKKRTIPGGIYNYSESGQRKSNSHRPRVEYVELSQGGRQGRRGGMRRREKKRGRLGQHQRGRKEKEPID